MAHMNVSLSQEVLAQLTHAVPKRQRSAFIAAAVGEKLARERQAVAARAAAGAWSDEGRGDATDEVRRRREEWMNRLRSEE